jgi:sugar fermentation stimulation protein A
VGINQGRINDYTAFFLRENAFIKMSPSVETLDREVKLGNSRVDFLINGRGHLEIKTPLEGLPCEGHPDYEGHSNTPVHPDRLIKYFADTSGAIRDGSRSLFLLCFMYDAPPFKNPLRAAPIASESPPQCDRFEPRESRTGRRT